MSGKWPGICILESQLSVMREEREGHTYQGRGLDAPCHPCQATFPVPELHWLTSDWLHLILPRFILCSKLWRSRNTGTESSWSSLALTTLLPCSNRNPEKMMVIEQILGRTMTWVLGILCVGPHMPTALSRQHSPWFSAMMGFPILVFFVFFVFVHFLNSYYLL